MSSHIAASAKRGPLWTPGVAAAAGGALVLAGQLLAVIPARAQDAPLDAFVQLLPWLLLAVVALLAALATPRLGLALLAGVLTFGLRYAGQMIIDRLPRSGIPHVVWVEVAKVRPVAPDWLTAIVAGETGLLTVSRVIVILGALVLLGAAVVAVWSLRPLLLGPASRASFGIDITVLLTLFALACMILSKAEFGGFSYSASGLLTTFDDYYQYANIRTLAWLVPLMLWLALVCRQGGALAVGAGCGLVLAVGALPWLMDAVAGAMGGPTSFYAYSVPDAPLGLESVKASSVLDPFTTPLWLLVPAALILVVSLWWALGTHSQGSPQNAVGTTTSPVNTLSVVAFVLAFIPVTAVAAIILGHMSYDNIIDGPAPQRGIGLSRWAIVLAYISAVGGAIVAYQALT